MAGVVIYSVLTNGYDSVPPLPKALVQGAECYLVTDNPDTEIPKESAWELKIVPKEKDPHRHQRRLKLCFHELFPDADIAIYLDANIHLTHAIKHILPLHKGGLTTGIQIGRASCRERV